jgi:hypothetical protein
MACDFSAIPAYADRDGFDLEGTSEDFDQSPAQPAAPPSASQPASPPPQAPSPPPSSPPAAPPGSPPAAPTGGGVTAVTFGRINAANTPSAMPDRIPPRIAQTVSVALTGTGSVTVAVDGASAANGSATINGGASATLSASGSVDIVGTAAPGTAAVGALSLTATAGGPVIGRSNAFRVAPIPTTVTISPAGLLNQPRSKGIRVSTSNDSDSGQVPDLDGVTMSEQVAYQTGTGALVGYTGSNSGFRPANRTPYGTDGHGTSVRWFTGPGAVDAHQMFIFNDTRTGASNIPVAKSGFVVRRELTGTAAALTLTVSKNPLAVTVTGSAAAGVGSASGSQRVI